MVDVNALKSSVRIEDVIQGLGINLKHNKACCPFHHEKTPSFTVNTDKQYFKCFGCGEGGDVIAFVRKFYNCDFNTAIQILIPSGGINLSPERILKKSDSNRKQQAFDNWVHDTYCNLCEARKRIVSMIEDENTALFDFNTLSQGFIYGSVFIDKIEWFLDVLSLGTTKEKVLIYKNYRKEVEAFGNRR